MSRKRRVLGAKFKAKVALAAVRGDTAVSQLSGQYGIHGNQVSSWKRKLLAEAAALFEDGRKGVTHAGIVYSKQGSRSIGEVVRYL